MLKPLILLTVMLLAPVGLAADAMPDPAAWYQESYGPLWLENPGDKIVALQAHYADEVLSHRADGTIERVARNAWMAGSIVEWLAEGWVGSELVGLQTDRINASTVAFKARWRDFYDAAADEYSCGWYLADFIEGQWQFTAYADLNCADHGLD